MDQLDRISVGDLNVLELITAENLPIELDHDEPWVGIEGFHDLMDREPGRNVTLLPVHRYLNIFWFSPSTNAPLPLLPTSSRSPLSTASR